MPGTTVACLEKGTKRKITKATVERLIRRVDVQQNVLNFIPGQRVIAYVLRR